MAPNVPAFPPEALRPRSVVEKGAEGMKKQILASSNLERKNSLILLGRRDACRLLATGAAVLPPVVRLASASAADGNPAQNAPSLSEVPAPRINYLPREGSFWDHWLHRAPNGDYHLYYLYEPPGVPEADSRKAWSVGHATSRDLVKWEERKVALAPGKHWWVDRGIATGSVIEIDNRYAMLVTGYSKGGRVGLGLAWSDDLENWTPEADAPVLEPSGKWYETPQQMRTNPPECAGFCDPYLVRQPGDAAVYAVFNTRVRDGAMYGRGSFALARSADLVRWEMLPPLFVPGYITRCETPQVFERGGRWYALASMWPKLMTDDFKKQHPDQRYQAAALVWTADKFEGPYRLAGDWALFPNADCYICKVVEAPGGGDAILTIRMTHKDEKMVAGLSPAYPVSYPSDGGIRVHYDKPLGD